MWGFGIGGGWRMPRVRGAALCAPFGASIFGDMLWRLVGCGKMVVALGVAFGILSGGCGVRRTPGPGPGVAEGVVVGGRVECARAPAVFYGLPVGVLGAKGAREAWLSGVIRRLGCGVFSGGARGPRGEVFRHGRR